MTLFKYGIITEFNPANMRGRVNFDDEDIVSDWLAVMVKKAKGDAHTHDLEPGEHVCCLMDQYAETGVIMGAIYSDKNNPSIYGKGITAVEFSDGTIVKYDTSTNELSVVATGSVKVSAPTVEINGAQSLTINSLNTTVNGPLTVAGPLTAGAGLVLSGAISPGSGGVGITLDGDISGSGELSVSGDVKAGTTSLKNHVHLSASPGTATGPPII